MNLRSTKRNSLSLAISIALGTGAPTVAAQTQIDEIIVTARKRTESLQDIPASVLAIPAREIQKADLRMMDDYARKIPALSYVARAPGANKIVFRGVNEAGTAFFTDSSAALYLDEQPLTQPSLTPEPRFVDIERIEALSGPQGTLFGASAQSGTLRIVTNKPDTTTVAADLRTTVRSGKESDTSYDINGMLNLPLVEDTFAIRLVGFSAKDGGFIDNVLGPSPGGTFTSEGFTADNKAGKAEFNGGRIAARWNINEDWIATASIVHQDVESTGNVEHMPDRVGDLQQVRFFDELREDTWTQYGLTIEGELGYARLISATSYFMRETSYQLDNTEYAAFLRTFYVNYSYLVSYAFGPDPRGLGSFNSQETNRFSQEFRLDGARDEWRWLVGLFYENFDDQWDFRASLDNYEDTNAFAFWQAAYDVAPGTSDDTYWHSNNHTRTEQIAAFGELTYTFAEDLALTFGGRWFRHERDRRFLVERPSGRLDMDSNPNRTEEDAIFKASASYRLTDNHMLYALYSEGFRNGGRNIARPGVVLPAVYDPDLLQNYELGIRTLWLDDRLQANATVFRMVWDDYQIGVVDPGPLFAVMVINAGNAEINGLELDFNLVPIPGLDVRANAIWLDAKTTSDNELLGVAAGARLPISPEFKASASLQYMLGFELLGGSPYARLDYSYHGDSLNSVECNTDFCFDPDVQPSYSIADLKIGIDAGSWEVNVFVKNIGDERAALSIVPGEPGGYNVVNRPREIGLGFSYRWGG